MDIVLFSVSDWGHHKQRPHHFSLGLAERGNRIFFLNPGASPVQRMKKSLFHPLDSIKLSITKIKNNIYVIDVPLRFPARIPGLNRFLQPILLHLNKNIMFWVFYQTVKIFKLKEFIIIVNNLYSFPTEKINRFRNVSQIINLLVYDCLDAYEYFSGVQRTKIRSMETKLVNAADIIFASSRSLLLRDILKNKEKTMFVPNGVEFSRFSQNNQIAPPEIEKLKRKKYIIAGYTGAIAEWIDFNFITKILTTRRNIAVCMIGPFDSLLTKLHLKSVIEKMHLQFGDRFIWLGPRKYEDIPKYIHNFDICIIPFKINELIYHVNPLKIYEYLAAGKPILSTYWPELDEFSKIVYFFKNHDRIEDIVDNILNDTKNVSLKEKRRQFVSQYDWQNIIENAYSYILSQLTK